MYQYDKTGVWIPKTIGNYDIIGRIGRGGMGDIFKAMQKSLNRIVALKVLTPHMGRSEEFSKRFEIEAKAISLLQHNNIVSIYEYGEEQGYKYFAMQFVDGYDLSTYIVQKKIIPINEIIDLSKQICRGLRYAHSKDIIHRDIKPQNILIDSNNTCRITDFGIAKIFAESNITMTGVAVGTPEYMSPEQAEGEPLDAQTDIYSLGIVIYEMLTKQPPFTGHNPVAIAYKQVHENPPSPLAIRKDTPRRLEGIVMKALKKNRHDRYRTIEAMLTDLDTVEYYETNQSGTRSLIRARKTTKHSFTQSPSTSIKTQELEAIDALTPQRHVLSVAYWQEVAKSQGLSLILIFMLIIAFMLHILGTF